jgi:hypothetical protein
VDKWNSSASNEPREIDVSNNHDLSKRSFESNCHAAPPTLYGTARAAFELDQPETMNNLFDPFL